MKLVVEGVSPRREELYQKAFRLLVKKFDIEGKAYTVWLTFFKEKPEQKITYNPQRGVGFVLSSIQGETCNTIIDGIIVMRINEYKSPKENYEHRRVTQPPMRTFVHEMTHVAQMVTGRLFTRQTPSGAKARWEGKWLDRLPRYEDQPWEHEADRLTPGLYEMLKQELRS